MADNLKHVEGDFPGQRNYRIYYQGWLPEKGPPAILLVAHGLAEHGGRYSKLAARFVPLGYGVFAPDHQGHGKSQGKPGYVVRFQDYLADLETFCRIICWPVSHHQAVPRRSQPGWHHRRRLCHPAPGGA